MAKAQMQYGEWAFLAGVLLAVILGLVQGAGVAILPAYVGPILVVLGVIVGALNITSKESHGFLLGSVALLLVTTAGLETLPYIGVYLASMLDFIAVFVAPASLIVALKVIYDLAVKK